jgi:hypothetical protein
MAFEKKLGLSERNEPGPKEFGPITAWKTANLMAIGFADQG